MSNAASNYLENKLLDLALRNTAWTPPSTLYLALFTGSAASNLESGILTNEVASGRGYARKVIQFGAASNGVSTNSNIVTFDPAHTTSWGTVTHVAVMDSATIGAGNVLFYGAVTISKTIEIGDTFQIAIGNLSITMN